MINQPDNLKHQLDKLPEDIKPSHFLQEVCNDAGYGPLVVDGLMGPKSKAQAYACLQELGDWMIVALVEERQMFYADIVTNDASQNVFLKGWLARARSFLPDYRVA